MKTSHLEILAPAGTVDMLHAAVLAGADAVYLGLQGLNARRTAGNFTPEGLQEAVSFCHGRGAKVYVALNTVVYPTDLAAVAEALAAVAAAGADAIIVQDLAVAALARQCVPGLALHASTQMSVHSLAGALQLATLGFTRVILSRELSLAEIAHITKHCGIETEVFVHGALCFSVSGQCYMSAFLGGRSGNRGGCAGPCRLPFDATPLVQTAIGHHLSLKDMSHLPALGALAAAGVCSAKIEGRLRSAEYAAAAVNACVQELAGEAFDKQLLQDVFSRSGFTDGYIENKLDSAMFGIRTGSDSAAAKAALPKLRELFRRELPRVPLQLTLTLEEDGAKLCAQDRADHKAVVYSQVPTQTAEKNLSDGYRRSLAKIGGTPFFLEEAEIICIPQAAQYFLPASEINEMRRSALEQLLAQRSALHPLPFTPPLPWNKLPPPRPQRQEIYAQFESISQMPDNATSCDGLIFPLAQWQEIPQGLQAKVWLALPRFLTPAQEEACAVLVEETANASFAGYFVQNMAHVHLCAGHTMLGGFGLNVANPLAGEAFLQMGVSALTASPEITCHDIDHVRQCGAKIAALAYGHMPLMLTRACPLHNVRTCADCKGEGQLLDRKGMQFSVRCTAQGAAGVRTIYNPIPIYMGDKKAELPADILLLSFSVETLQEAGMILKNFTAGRAFDGAFTRGLYFKGTSD